MSKIVFFIITLCSIISCDISKGPRLESNSYLESRIKNRFIAKYKPNKSKICYCGDSLKIRKIWAEKYRSDLHFYNYILNLKLFFFEELDVKFKAKNNILSYANTQERIIVRDKNFIRDTIFFIVQAKSCQYNDTILYVLE